MQIAQKATEAAWFRRLTVTQRFEMYADLFSTLLNRATIDETRSDWRTGAGTKKSPRGSARSRRLQDDTSSDVNEPLRTRLIDAVSLLKAHGIAYVPRSENL